MDFLGVLVNMLVLAQVKCSVPHYEGSKCADTLSGDCTGPYTLQRTSKPCSGDIGQLNACIKECIALFCCRSGAVGEGGRCVISATEDDNMHFVKTAPEGTRVCTEGKIASGKIINYYKQGNI